MSARPILVVDDDPKIVALVQTYLEREGFAVATAADGKTALAKIGETMPRLIVLDIMLPELDGLALMRILRERSEVPIVLLSARASTADRVLGIHEGADDYIVKPFSPAELVVRIKAVLRRTERAQSPAKVRGALPFIDLAIDLDLQVLSARVQGNGSWLHLAIRELLDNAVRFRPAPTGRIGVRVSRAGADVVLSVMDDGFGIDPRHHGQLFKRFARIETEQNSHLVGLGIGLYLVQEVAHAHGGRVMVNSEAGVGSEFRLLLPSSDL